MSGRGSVLPSNRQRNGVVSESSCITKGDEMTFFITRCRYKCASREHRLNLKAVFALISARAPWLGNLCLKTLSWRGETKTSKSTVGTLSESKYWRGKEGRGFQVGEGIAFPQWAFSRQFCRISLRPGMDNKAIRGLLSEWSICLDIYKVPPTSPGRSFLRRRHNSLCSKGRCKREGDESSKFLADDTSLEGVNDDIFWEFFASSIVIIPPIRLTFFLEDLVINGNHVILLARETKTSKSTVGTLSESKYWRGKEGRDCRWGRDCISPQWAFSRQFCRISLTPGMDNKRFVVCFRDGSKTYLPSRGKREHFVASHT
ncbi:hypothetical protein CEXT_806551 [Caerostris extrusa]|uniref:Uncharacterized protein n=1 Tax=Caerostris extrusa TaxID=172846 RepID=A0AAV4UD61_CAEEX|nr:hypothetical protein CEXT_806551 [Caerostris extrusa]